MVLSDAFVKFMAFICGFFKALASLLKTSQNYFDLKLGLLQISNYQLFIST